MRKEERGKEEWREGDGNRGEGMGGGKGREGDERGKKGGKGGGKEEMGMGEKGREEGREKREGGGKRSGVMYSGHLFKHVGTKWCSESSIFEYKAAM